MAKCALNDMRVAFTPGSVDFYPSCQLSARKLQTKLIYVVIRRLMKTSHLLSSSRGARNVAARLPYIMAVPANRPACGSGVKRHLLRGWRRQTRVRRRHERVKIAKLRRQRKLNINGAAHIMKFTSIFGFCRSSYHRRKREINMAKWHNTRL